MTEEEKEEMELTRFGGVVVNSLSLSGKLQNMGWYKGEVGDGGGFDTYYRYDRNKNVELDFSGDYIACLDTDVIVYGAHFGRSIAGESQGLAPCRLGETDPRQSYSSQGQPPHRRRDDLIRTASDCTGNN